MLEHTQALVLDPALFAHPDSFQSHGQQCVISRSGELELLDINRIARAITAASEGLDCVDHHRVIAKALTTIGDCTTTRELDERCMAMAATFISQEPQYATLAARLLAAFIDKEVTGLGALSFSRSVLLGYEHGLINERVYAIVMAHQALFDSAINEQRTSKFDYRGLRTLYDHYLLRHPESGQVMETAQFMWMRMAVSLSTSMDGALILYKHFSLLEYLPSLAMLRNGGTYHEQLSSCFLLDPPERLSDLVGDGDTDMESAAKLSSDVGVTWHGVRSAVSVVGRHAADLSTPWLDMPRPAMMEDIDLGSAQRGACVFLEPWHAGIHAFLDSPGITSSNNDFHHLNLAHWVCDLFMQRVESDQSWSLFEPADVPELSDLFGEEFDQAYLRAESSGLAKQVVRARELYEQMMLNIVQTGNGWMTFKDKANRACNQTGMRGNMVHLSGPCTEILEVTQHGDMALCNLGTLNLARHVTPTGFDFQKLAHTVKLAVRQLDQVVDLNTYPLTTAKDLNLHWRPVGLGAMGLQDVFFTLRLPFDGFEARQLSTQIAETIYYHALQTSMEMARDQGAHAGFADTRAAHGELQFDAWGVTPSSMFRWDELRQQIQRHGLRNSLLIAIAPTTNVAAIAGCYECIEPQISNALLRPAASGTFMECNRYLVADLKELGLWSEAMQASILRADGSVQGLYEIPEQVRTLYRTAWELSTLALIDLAADRGAFVDQSQSLRLFMADPNVRQLSRLYLYAWKSGLKTTYLVRSRWPREISDTDDFLPHTHNASEHVPARDVRHRQGQVTE